jgi:hypothetical protein
MVTAIMRVVLDLALLEWSRLQHRGYTSQPNLPYTARLNQTDWAGCLILADASPRLVRLMAGK